MLEKFDKYWSEYSVVLVFGAVLDPRFKFKVLQKLYAKVETNPTKCQAYIEMLRKKLYKLYDQYVSAIGSNSSRPSSSTIMHSRVESQVAKKYPKRLFDDVLDVSDEIVEPVEISELDRYLEQPCYEMKFYQDLDVLDHWKGCVKGFPILSRMTRDLLAIPITTVASESAFSIGARVLTKYRSCMLPEKVQTLICTRNWLHGFNMGKLIYFVTCYIILIF
nr:zinc finger BED domain-containing protein RICESLEEPER 2-like [Ipomoea batatas]